MTIIAYRAGLMAADTMAVIENQRARTAVKFLAERKIMQRRVHSTFYRGFVAC